MNIVKLPEEVLVLILEYLSTRDKRNLQTCETFHHTLKNNKRWRRAKVTRDTRISVTRDCWRRGRAEVVSDSSISTTLEGLEEKSTERVLTVECTGESESEGRGSE